MSSARVLVGTCKSAFILSSDATRARWKVSGPRFGGWEVFRVARSPADPDRIYASQSNSWFGQLVQRPDGDGDGAS